MDMQKEIEAIAARIQREVEEAERRGLVVTVERVSVPPFAMGRAQYRVDVRESLERIRRWRDYQDRVDSAAEGRLVPDDASMAPSRLDGSD